MFRNKRVGTAIAVAGVCAAGGVVAGIAGSAAAPSKSSSTSSTTGAAATTAVPPRWRPGRLALRRRVGRAPVHAQLIVPNEAGTGFDTVTMDNGKLKSLSGNQLAITEGTPKATYRTVTLTIPSNATVRRNWAKASLSDLKAGDYVHVLVGPRGTFVGANDARHRFPRFGMERGFRHPGGPPGPDGPPGPPPGPGGPPPPGMP